MPRSPTCSCLVSTDNGRSFERRGTIAADPSGRLQMNEFGNACGRNRPVQPPGTFQEKAGRRCV